MPAISAARLHVPLWLAIPAFVVPAGAADSVKSVPLAPRSAATKTLFESLSPEKTGVRFVNPIDIAHPWKFLYASSMSTGGVAAGDFDGDGRPDLFFGGGPGKNRLYRQTAAMAFEDVTAKAGVDGGDAWATGCAMADVNGDGRLDIYVCNYLTPNQLFINNGDGTFSEKAKEFRLDIADACHTPTFCDYDGDGNLDLYILTNRWYRPGGTGFPDEQTIEAGPGGRPVIMAKWEKYYDAVQVSDTGFETKVVGRPDFLLRNNGDGTFSDVTKKAGITHRGHGLSVTWFDWNGDHRPDLWIGNDFDDADRLYRNNPDGTFTDVTLQTVTSTTWFSMGADFGDVDGDAWPDFFIADMAGSNHFKQKTAMGNMGNTWFMEHASPAQLMRNCLFINARNGRFMESGFLAGLARTNWTWAVRLADLDNDGRNDVYVQSGMARNFNEKDDPSVLEKDPTKSQWDRYEKLPPMKEACLSFRNEGDLKFKDTSKAWGLDYTGMSYGCALADLDGDGDLDIISVRLDEPAAILRNNSQSGRSLTVELRGTGKNPFGLGAEVRLTTAAAVQVRQLIPTRGYLGQDEPVIHFGLGTETSARELTVIWPSGRRQVLENLEAGRKYIISEAPDAAPIEKPAAPAPRFARTSIDSALHRQARFDDFSREPLLPNRMSQWGPGQAWADVDGDGFDDLFLGQGRGTPRRIFFNRGGKLQPSPDPIPDNGAGDDMGAVFFDADADGDSDLFVVSGGVTCNAGDSSLQDRLYLNDGKGRFSPAASGVIPAETDSGGPVAAADFDRDGDLDLFVGGRSVPGAYPLPGRSHLLRNEGGKFTDAVDAAAPGLAAAGMVTGAVWADLNSDGWPDLALSMEWGPITVFLNQSGKLTLLADRELTSRSGWWNGITAADLDGDGAMDLLATNFGLNTKYHASPAHPVLIYYGDMDGSGTQHIVEAEWEGDTLFPVRGRSCSSQAMPFIKDKFTTFKSFAKASLPAIYSPQKLEQAKKFTATHLESSVFWNDGKGRFSCMDWPWQVQTAPAFGIVVSDVDHDGKPDVAIGQNFSYAQVETGRMAGGLSVLLMNQGDRKFQPVAAAESGFSLAGDVRSMAVVDFEADGMAELAVAFNNAPAMALRRPAPPAPASRLTVALKGKPGNPTAVGARVSVSAPGLPLQSAEVRAGEGYLTQGSSRLYFGLGDRKEADVVTVRWPDGRESTFKHPGTHTVLLLPQP